MAQPTTRLLKAPSTTARYERPACVGPTKMSALRLRRAHKQYSHGLRGRERVPSAATDSRKRPFPPTAVWGGHILGRAACDPRNGVGTGPRPAGGAPQAPIRIWIDATPVRRMQTGSASVRMPDLTAILTGGGAQPRHSPPSAYPKKVTQGVEVTGSLSSPGGGRQDNRLSTISLGAHTEITEQCLRKRWVGC